MREAEKDNGAGRAASLVEVTRGRLVESRHRGHLAAVDADGRLVAFLGDPGLVTFARSACKPQQAVPLLASGAAEAFGLTDAEVAVACASHNGEPIHTEAALSVLRKAGLAEQDLECGPQAPYGERAAKALRGRGEEPRAVHNNCSGKHAGMLALAVHLGAPTGDYFRPENPVQREVLRSIVRFTGVPAAEIGVGTDGCGLPTFALPLRAMALMQARLVAPPREWDAGVRDACRRITASVRAHPEMVGDDGELDTELMRRAPLVSKVGAEGVYTAGVLPSERWPLGLGLAFKIEDGDRGARARSPAAVEALRQLGVLGKREVEALAGFASADVKNRRGDVVGCVRSNFKLESA